MTKQTRIGIAAVVAVVLVVAWIARIREGQRALAESDGALSRGDYAEAIFEARAAADARCPLCSAPELGNARLYAIAKDAEAKNDIATSIAAWRAVRAAALSSSVIDTAPDRRKQADGEIARLGHKMDASAAAAGATASPAASEEKLRAALAESHVPSGATLVLLALGSLLFFGGAGALALERAPRTTALGAVAASIGLVAAALLLF